jgi:hypothetical protein
MEHKSWDLSGLIELTEVGFISCNQVHRVIKKRKKENSAQLISHIDFSLYEFQSRALSSRNI